MADKNDDHVKTISERLADDPSKTPTEHEAELQAEERQRAGEEAARENARMAKEGPMGPEVNTPNLSASVVDGHDLSEHVENDGRSVKGGTVSHTGNDASKTPGPSGATGKK